MALHQQAPFAPGARVVVRDTEWLVRSVDRSSTGGQALTCVGLSELVRDKEAIFLTDLEARRRPIQILHPADTTLVSDTSHAYQDSLLYLESLLRQTPPTGKTITIGHQAAMDPVPYQLEPTLQALEQTRQRILIADAVGLGKTLEAGVLLSELIRRGRGKRILVVTMKSMLTQFQKELWTRFAIPLTRLDSIGLQRVRSRIPTNHNPFYHFDKSIISVDTLKQDNEFKVHLEKAKWDVIVIDEAQNVAERGHSRTQRARLAKLLARQSDSLIMLSATPHDGRAQSFASLMNMLDPTAIADPEHYGPDDIQGLFIRRFKKDIQHQVQGAFQERRISTSHIPASTEEEAAYDSLVGLELHTRRGTGSGAQLFKITLEKALFSSPAACLETIDARLKRLAKGETSSNPEADTQALNHLRDRVAAITPAAFSRFNALVRLLTDASSELYWTGRNPQDRLVLFTERIATLDFLQAHLPDRLGLASKHVAVLHGGLSDIEQQQVVEEFGREESPVRLLLASDVASEGINLHYLSHRLIHFDIPWSLMVFQQRNGRIDRYGQEAVPRIHYLLTQSQTPKIHGDMRILELLVRKDEEATKNIGDPSALMGVYDIDAEEATTAVALEQGQSAEEFEAQSLSATTGEDLDLLAFLEQGQQSTPEPAVQDHVAPMPSLFPSDFDYMSTALQALGRDHNWQFETDTASRIISLDVPDDLGHRFRFLPRDVQPRDNRLTLTEDKTVMQEEIKRCRKDEEAWPRLHYLWPLHPAAQWINDRVQTRFNRHEAPVLTLPHLEPGELVYLLTGIIPNRKGQPLIQEWFAITVHKGKLRETVSLDAVLERTGLATATFANPGDVPINPEAQTLLPDVVHTAQEWMRQRQHAFEGDLNPRLSAQLQRLEELKDRHKQTIQRHLEEQNIAAALKNRRRDEREREVETLFAEYMEWVEQTMSTEEHAYIKVAAVLQGH